MNICRHNTFRIAVSCLFLATASIAEASSISRSDQPEWLKKYTDQEVRDMFQNPPMFYAPHTFWFWDDVIKDEQTAAAMAEEMAKQKLNPGYAHPRSGFDNRVTALPIEQYLAEPWFTSFGNAMQKAKEKGLTLGFCDEYNWPSGHGAGKILEKHPELTAMYLSPRRYYIRGKTEVKYDSIDFAVAGKIINNQLDAASLRIIGEGKHVQWDVPDGDWMIYTYTKKPHQGIDGGKVNYLDPKLMEVFIPMVHEQYDKRFKNEMGKTIPGVFVDNEGDYGWKMAWSEHLAKTYRQKKKRDIRTWLPLLTEKDKDGLFVVARCDWFDVVSEVYTACYFEPLVTWLKERNMYYISNLWEESLQLQTIAVGDLMRTTRAVTMPGNDCLEMKSQEVHDFKEIQSVAEFEDRPFMSEIMGVAGWIQTPEMMKMTINSITSFGVNHVVPHGINMNRQIETIPFPSDWYTENPYWDYMHYWTDFARRAAFVTRQSRLVADVLLVNPQENAWSFSENYFSEEKGVQDSPWDERVVEVDQVYSNAMKVMNERNIDFLIADKYYLGKGRVQTSGGEAKITISNHDFRAIVVPSTYIIPRSSMDKIYKFAQKGGVVVLLGALPHGSPEEGLNDYTIIQQVKALLHQPNVIHITSPKDRMEKMVVALNQKITPQIRMENSDRLFTAQRKNGRINYYWFANNTDTPQAFTAWLRDGEGNAEIWNCETGKKENILSTRENGYKKVNLTLHPFEAYWVVFDPDNSESDVSKQIVTTTKERIIDTKWSISYPDSSHVYKTTAKVLYSDDPVVDSKKLKRRYNDVGWNYYSRQKENTAKGKYSYCRINIPIGATSVVIPSYLLGKEIWVDDNRIKVTDSLLSLPPKTELLAFALKFEDAFSIAPFKFEVGRVDNKQLASWYSYGLQQYTGFLEYETSVVVDDLSREMYIDLGEVKFVAEVFVNGISVGARLWPPFKFDISDAIRSGENKIRIRIGNLIANEMWMKDDLGELRTWGWKGTPDLNQCDAGLFGPVRLVLYNP
ncbi:glycosyl hydrolase [Parabacteroides pacaensis]|uniref:glycosyl hydrolase n=1 Tax=Parabacteroides pacaensis TaxID=2086575 RepID=UPI00131E1583|nr:glycosyl hydrolase [Parabacteroides pacaensis]